MPRVPFLVARKLDRVGETRLVACVGALLVCAPAPADLPTFTRVNDEANIHFVHTLNSNTRYSRQFASGPAAGDFDNDGDIDLFLPQAYDFPNELYRNNGDGTFSEVAVVAGVASLKESRAALWIDYDNDGWLDLFVANDPDAPNGQKTADPATTSNLLYRNQRDGTFVDVSVAAGVSQMPNPEPLQTLAGLAAADIDNDGFLDIYVSCWHNQNALFHNNGDGTFSEIGVSAGVFVPGYSWAPMFHDVDRDGWIDLLLNMDFGPNLLLINQHDNTFVDVAATAGFATTFNEMGMTLGDYDNDGDLDVLATNVESPYPDQDPLDKWTVLLHNDSVPGAPSFSECAQAAGVARTGWGWGCTWFDADNDGRLDLAVTNGFQGPFRDDPSRLFLNLGNGLFDEISTTSGFDSTLSGRGLIAFDYDADGDLDLYETNYSAEGSLFRNDTSAAGHWVAFDLLAGTPGNRFAVGAEISLTAGTMTQMRLITAGTSFLSQEPYRAFFGLGNSGVVDEITVRWHDGTLQTLFTVPGDRIVRIRQGVGVIEDGDLDADGDTDFDDLVQFAACMTGPGEGLQPGCGSADVDLDRDADLADFAQMTLNLGSP